VTTAPLARSTPDRFPTPVARCCAGDVAGGQVSPVYPLGYCSRRVSRDGCGAMTGRLITAVAVLMAFAAATACAAVTTIPPSRYPPGCDPNGLALQGDAADDIMEGTPQRDLLRGGGGDDYLVGHGRADCLFGQRGTDQIDGRGGGDAISGGPHLDVLSGGEGADTIRAARGGDALHGDQGNRWPGRRHRRRESGHRPHPRRSTPCGETTAAI
jgi:RTX calcium-binding nonapeptide repeat (4 copies)